jgi:hypothetical protein
MWEIYNLFINELKFKKMICIKKLINLFYMCRNYIYIINFSKIFQECSKNISQKIIIKAIKK